MKWPQYISVSPIDLMQIQVQLTYLTAMPLSMKDLFRRLIRMSTVYQLLRTLGSHVQSGKTWMVPLVWEVESC